MVSSSSKCFGDERNRGTKDQVMSQFESIATSDLSSVCGGDGAPGQQPQAPQPQHPADYSTNSSNPIQQFGQMVDNASGAFQGARKAGASVYESIGNAAIGFFNLGGGFARNGQPR